MRTKFVAVLPDDPISAEGFLHQHNIVVDEIARARLPELGVDGTPTLMIVDGHGKVVNEWVGSLDPAGEKEVISELN